MLLTAKRAEWGARLDARLPQPELRAALRGWRRSRPFWGGLLLMAAGAELLIVPLSPFGVLISLGIGGLAAIAIGLALILAGGFLWAAPHARTYVSLNALLLSVLSFAATNLGGFVVGTLLGVAGSALGFGWKPVPGDVKPGDVTEEEVATGGRPDDAGEGQRRRRGRKLLGLLLPAALLTAVGDPTASDAQAAPAADGAGRVALAPAAITTDRFSPEGFAFAGTEEVQTAEGPMKVIVLRMKAATLTDYRLGTRDTGGAQQELTADKIEMRGHVTLYMRRFAGCIQGTPLCLSFSPETLPAPPVVPPFVYMTKVRAEQALITTDSIKVDNLGITTRAARAVELDYGGTKPADEQRGAGKPGGSDGEGDDEDKGDDRNGPGLPGRREERPPEKRPGDLKLTDLKRAASDVPWCDKVTLTVSNTGGRTVSGADITFTSHIVGAIGVDWVTETSRRELPELEADEKETKTWRVCVDEKHAPRFLLGRHLEHEAAVDSPGPGSTAEPVPVPYP